MNTPGMRPAAVLAMFLCSCGSSSSPATSHHDGGVSSGGDDGGIPSFTGVTPCGQSVDAGTLAEVECALSMPVQGGLSDTIHVPKLVIVCGSSSDAQGVSTVDFGTGTGDGGSVDVTLAFESELPYDQAGTFPAHVLIAEGSADGGSAQWQTPPGACSVVVAGSLCIQTLSGSFDGGARTRRVLSGTGSCTQPAAPLAGNPAAPVTIGSFTYISSVGP
ncbi:MAG: hypothetical protein ACRELB_18175 [Polyangiaceae bacterium]